MKPGDRIQAFEKDSKILEKIADQYPHDSGEYAALERAAIALWYVLTEDYERFHGYFREYKKGDLTSAQRAHLQELGIEPDANE